MHAPLNGANGANDDAMLGIPDGVEHSIEQRFPGDDQAGLVGPVQPSRVAASEHNRIERRPHPIIIHNPP